MHTLPLGYKLDRRSTRRKAAAAREKMELPAKLRRCLLYTVAAPCSRIHGVPSAVAVRLFHMLVAVRVFPYATIALRYGSPYDSIDSATGNR